MKSCKGCRHDLGDGYCRINMESECREGGGFELWEADGLISRARLIEAVRARTMDEALAAENLPRWGELDTITKRALRAQGKMIKKVIGDQPVCASEPMRGVWMREMDDEEGNYWFSCSACGEQMKFGALYDYCSSCGARMNHLAKGRNANDRSEGKRE